MRGKIKDGNIVVYKSDYSRSFIKDKELYDLYKGIPYVVKEINGLFYLFWKGHEVKTIFKHGDKTLTYIGDDSNFKVIGNINMPRKNYKELSGYEYINTEYDFNSIYNIFGFNKEEENAEENLEENKKTKKKRKK